MLPLNWLYEMSKFQSPMGIGITSNVPIMLNLDLIAAVSIPNGDRHYLERSNSQMSGMKWQSFNPQWG